MSDVIELKDDYQYSKHIHILVSEQLRIPSLITFGKQTRTSATESLPPHYHNNCFEFVYISTGSAIFSIDDKNYSLSGGDVFVSIPNQVHSTDSMPISVCEMYWFQLAAEPEQLLFLNPSAAKHLLKELFSFKQPQLHTDSREIYPLIKSAFDQCVRGDNPYLAGQYLALLLYKFIEYQKEKIVILTPEIKRTRDYILTHITEEFSLDELASISHLSTSQFKQKFKNEVGFSPRQFINYEKIEYSKKLLLEGKDVTQVASMLGFDNSSYFSVVFKRFTMCSPTQFLKNNKKKLV